MGEGMAEESRKRCLLYLAGLVLLALLVVALILVPWWVQWQGYQETASETAQRISRYHALLESRDELKSRLDDLQKRLRKHGYFLEAANAELAAAELQQLIKETVEKAEGTLVSTQHVQGGEATGRLRPVEIKVRMKGDVESLAKVLLELQGSNPVVSVEDLTVRSRRTVKGRRKNRVEGYSLDVNFRVVGYLLEAPR